MNNHLKEGELFLKYKSSYKSALTDLLIHLWFFSYAFYFMWYLKNSWLSVLPITLTTFLLNRTFVIFHDCCHNSYTPSKNLNYIISHITGSLVLTSPNWFLDHNTHHLTNGNLENKQHYFFNETVLLTKQKYIQSSLKSKKIYNFYKNPLLFFTIIPIIYFGIAQRFIYILKKYNHPHKYKQTFLEILFNHFLNNISSCYFLYNIFYYQIFIHYFICFSLSSSISFIMFHNQHTYNPSFVVTNKEWTQRNSGLLCSSFIQIPNCLKYFYMGIEYHHIHHMNSKIPGYNLQKFHEEVVSKSNLFDNIIKLTIADCYNNLWLILYDETKKKYITVKEIDDEILKETVHID
jgi:omega-6 fatty acid desaturase (delta-12 desaturase)